MYGSQDTISNSKTNQYAVEQVIKDKIRFIHVKAGTVTKNTI